MPKEEADVGTILSVSSTPEGKGWALTAVGSGFDPAHGDAGVTWAAPSGKTIKAKVGVSAKGKLEDNATTVKEPGMYLLRVYQPADQHDDPSVSITATTTVP